MKMWIGNLDGRREGLVIASSKKRAIKVVDSSRTDFNRYWTLHDVDTSLEPEVLYTRPIRPGTTREPWQQGRCLINTSKKAL